MWSTFFAFNNNFYETGISKYYIVKKIIPQELNYMIYYMKMWHDSLTWMIQINWYIYWTVKWELSSTRLESSSMITCDALCRYMNLVTTSSYKHCIHFLSCSFFTIWIFVMYTYLCIFTCPSLGPNWSINILNLESCRIEIKRVADVTERVRSSGQDSKTNRRYQYFLSPNFLHT